jgi:diacylglycerol kinase (ATP)
MLTATRSGPVVLVVNPTSEHHIDYASDLLLRAGVSVGEVVSVTQVDAMRPRGFAWRQRKYTAVVAAGGDGTIGAVVSQIADSGLPLGILPFGTSNDVLRCLGIPLDVASACANVASGIATEVDVGIVRPARVSSSFGDDLRDRCRAIAQHILPPGQLRTAITGGESRFIHAVTLGLNVEFARLATDVAHRRRWGPLTYATASIQAISKLRAIPVTLHLREPSTVNQTGSRTADLGNHSRMGHGRRDEHTITYQAVQVAVVNTPVFGGALNLRLPGADPRDRLLDVVVIEALEPRQLRETVEGLVATLSALAESAFPTPYTQPLAEAKAKATAATESAADSLLLTEEAALFAFPGVHHFQARGIRIETPAGTEMTLDGEIVAHTPAEIRVARDSLRVLLPAEARRRLLETQGPVDGVASSP